MPGEALAPLMDEPPVVETPPVETPPVETPPVETPPVETPPVETPPVEQTDEEKAAAEEERRAALTDEERAAEDAANAGAPEEYAEFEVAEGIELDADAIEAFKPIAKELGLTQDQAQKLVDVQAATAQRWQEAVQQHVIDTRLGWREAAQKDPEIGGEKFAENLAIAKEGRDVFGDEELKTLLDESGLGDHPAVIRHFFKVGQANREHDFVTSGKPEKSRSFYDHPTSKK